MAVKKLSQITPAAAAPALTDQVVGVTGGSADNLFSLTQIQTAVVTRGLPAGGNLTFYVATTGSDSNPGTLAAPFATIQHAVNITAQYDYQNAFAPTVNVAAGTYTLTAGNPIQLPTLLNCVEPNFNGTINGAGNTTTIIDGVTNGASIFEGSGGSQSNWFIQGVRTNTTSGRFHYYARDSSQIFIEATTIDVNDSAASTATFVFTAGNYGIVTVLGSTINVLAGIDAFLDSDLSDTQTINGLFFFQNNTLNLPGFANSAGHTGVKTNSSGYSEVVWSFMTVTNGANYGAHNVDTLSSETFFQVNNSLSDIPGTAASKLDQGCGVFTGTGAIYTAAFNQVAGAPTTAQVTSQQSSFVKDTTNGQRYIAFNDGGTVFAKQVGRTVNTQTGASYTMALSDQDGRVEMNNAGANTFTVPQDSAFSPTAPPVGTEVRVVQTGAGATTIAAGASATVNNAGVVGGQWKSVMVYKTAANTWTQTNV